MFPERFPERFPGWGDNQVPGKIAHVGWEAGKVPGKVPRKIPRDVRGVLTIVYKLLTMIHELLIINS